MHVVQSSQMHLELRLCSIMNTWKNVLVVVVAADRPLDHHVLRALNFG